MATTDRAAPSEPDPVIEAYKRDVDRTLLRENLRLTPWARLAKHQSMHDFVARWRGRARHAVPVEKAADG